MADMSRAQRAVFRLPAASIFLPALVVLCVTPLATAGGAWAVLFLAPVVALAYILITRTSADRTGVRVHGLFGTRAMAWRDMAGLELQGSRWAVAVSLTGRRLRLPMVRPRDLPTLASVSGGSIHLTPPARDSSVGPERADDDPDRSAEPGRRPAESGGVAGS